MSLYTYRPGKNLKFDNVKWWQGCRDERALMLGSVDAGELPGTTYHIKKMKSQQLKNKLKLKEKKRNQQLCSQVIHPSQGTSHPVHQRTCRRLFTKAP